jgi:ribosome-associated translation inhibitor RaiA
LFGHQLGITDHFKPNIEEKLKKSVSLYGQTPNHIPQNILLQILYERL